MNITAPPQQNNKLTPIEQIKLARLQKEFPSINSADDALNKAIDCEAEAKLNIHNGNSEYWFQCVIDLNNLALLLEKHSN